MNYSINEKKISDRKIYKRLVY